MFPFARKASGLVKTVSTKDSIVGNLLVLNVVFMSLTMIWLPSTFPGGDMVLATLLTFPGALCLAIVYVLFGVALPRSGGDYVFVSRSLHPAVGFVGNFSFYFWMPVWFAWMAAWFTQTGLSAMFTMMGFMTNNAGFSALGATLGEPIWVFVIGTIVSLVAALVTISGVKKGLNLMWVTFVIAIVGVMLSVFLVAANSPATYTAAFNRYASSSDVISAAAGTGYFPTGIAWNDFGATLKMVPLLALVLTWPMLSIYVASELKEAKRNIPIGVLGALVIGTILLALVGWTITSVIGNELMGSVTLVDWAAPAAYPFPVVPSYLMFSSLLTNSVPLLLLMGIGTAVWGFANLLFEYIITPRMVLAWAFDRIFPKKFAEVSPRFHTPVPAIILTFGLTEVFLLMYVYIPNVVLFFGSMMFVYAIIYAILGISAIVFPFRRKDLYKGSPADIKVAGIPLMAIFGVGTVVFMVWLIYMFLSDAAYLLNSTTGLVGVGFSFVLGIAIYIIAHFVRKKQGISLGMVYKEIPPD